MRATILLATFFFAYDAEHEEGIVGVGGNSCCRSIARALLYFWPRLFAPCAQVSNQVSHRLRLPIMWWSASPPQCASWQLRSSILDKPILVAMPAIHIAYPLRVALHHATSRKGGSLCVPPLYNISLSRLVRHMVGGAQHSPLARLCSKCCVISILVNIRFIIIARTDTIFCHCESDAVLRHCECDAVLRHCESR